MVLNSDLESNFETKYIFGLGEVMSHRDLDVVSNFNYVDPS